MQTVNLFVAGLGATTTEEQLRELFEKFGKINSTKIMLDSRTGASRGFGFVLFAQREDGMKALDAMNGAPFGSSTLHISLSQHDGRSEQSTRLYVRNIPANIPNATVHEYFSQFGAVVSMNIRPDTSGYAGGPVRSHQASVEFSKPEVAAHVLKSIHGKTPFEGGNGPILAKYAESSNFRASRRVKKEINSNHRTNNKHIDTNTTLPPNPVYINSAPVAVPFALAQVPVIVNGFSELAPGTQFNQPQQLPYTESPAVPQPQQQPLLKLSPTAPLLFPTTRADEKANDGSSPFLQPAFMVMNHSDVPTNVAASCLRGSAGMR